MQEVLKKEGVTTKKNCAMNEVFNNGRVVVRNLKVEDTLWILPDISREHVPQGPQEFVEIKKEIDDKEDVKTELVSTKQDTLVQAEDDQKTLFMTNPVKEEGATLITELVRACKSERVLKSEEGVITDFTGLQKEILKTIKVKKEEENLIGELVPEYGSNNVAAEEGIKPELENNRTNEIVKLINIKKEETNLVKELVSDYKQSKVITNRKEEVANKYRRKISVDATNEACVRKTVVTYYQSLITQKKYPADTSCLLAKPMDTNLINEKLTVALTNISSHQIDKGNNGVVNVMEKINLKDASKQVNNQLPKGEDTWGAETGVVKELIIPVDLNSILKEPVADFRSTGLPPATAVNGTTCGEEKQLNVMNDQTNQMRRSRRQHKILAVIPPVGSDESMADSDESIADDTSEDPDYSLEHNRRSLFDSDDTSSSSEEDEDVPSTSADDKRETKKRKVTQPMECVDLFDSDNEDVLSAVDESSAKQNTKSVDMDIEFVDCNEKEKVDTSGKNFGICRSFGTNTSEYWAEATNALELQNNIALGLQNNSALGLQNTSDIAIEHISDYLRTPYKLAVTRGVVNVPNVDFKSFLWSILALLYPVNNYRCSKLRSHMEKINMFGIKYPVSVKSIDIFELLNPAISVNVLGYDTEVYPVRLSMLKRRKNHIYLILLIGKVCTHYCAVTSISRLLCHVNPISHRQYYCKYCLRRYNSQHSLDKHFVICEDSETDIATVFKNLKCKNHTPAEGYGKDKHNN